MNKLKRDTGFSHLSVEVINQVIKEYYEKTPMKELQKKYNLPISSAFHKHFPLFDTDEKCQFCDSKMVVVPHRVRYIENSAICTNCYHQNEGFCPCETCHEIRNQAYNAKIKAKQDRIKDHLESESIKIPLLKLSIDEKINLGILIREMTSDDLTYIKPFSSKENWNRYQEILLPLKEVKIVTVHPESNNNEIKVTENKFGETILNYNSLFVKWRVNVTHNDMSVPELFRYLAKGEWQAKLTNEEIFQLWKKTAKIEALMYLANQCKQILKVEFENNFVSDSLLESLTNHFSIGQIYNIIKVNTDKTLRFIVERKPTKDHTYNYLLKCMKNYAENAIQNNYALKHFEKPRYLTDNPISDFFFDYILKSKSQGFRILPSEIYDNTQFESTEAEEPIIDEFKTVGYHLKTNDFFSVSNDIFGDDIPF